MSFKLNINSYKKIQIISTLFFWHPCCLIFVSHPSLDYPSCVLSQTPQTGPSQISSFSFRATGDWSLVSTLFVCGGLVNNNNNNDKWEL